MRPLYSLEDAGSNPAARCLPIFLLLIIIQQLSYTKFSQLATIMMQPLVRRLAAVAGHVVVVTRENSSAQEVEDNINDPSSDGKIKKESHGRAGAYYCY